MAFLKIHYFVAIAYFSIYGITAFPEEKEAIEQDIEIEQRLKMLNKPAIKSIQLDYAIFDCVDIYKQPAFDHPLLKNHKIQMKPSNWLDMSYSKGNKIHSTRQILFHAFDESLDCPDGTVPIRRTSIEDLQREKFLRNVSSYYPLSTANTNAHFAIMSIEQDKRYKVTGAKGSLDIQNPSVNDGETSGAQVWLFNTNSNGSDVEDGITAGWMVDPQFYGNSSTYFTASWKGKGGGCINLRCPGFVQISQSSPLGFLITNISKYGGPLYAMPVWIQQDNATKNWWLTAGANQVSIGYWPKELFSTFDDGAPFLTYGGFVGSIPNQPSPPMGSGYSEKCHIDHTSFFCNLEYQITDDVLGGIYIPPRTHKTIVPKRNCRNYVVRFSCKDMQEIGYYFLYGGPRGNC